MKKTARLFIVIAIILFSVQTYASGIGFGIRGGLNFSSVPSADEFSFIGSKTDDGMMNLELLPDSYTGFHFGLFGRLMLGNIFIQPELLYVESGQKMAIRNSDLNGGGTTEFTQEFSHLKIPALAGIQFGPIHVGVGPVASILLDSTKGHIENLTLNYNTATIGYKAIAGIKFGNLMLDFRFEDNLSEFGDGIMIGSEEFSFDSRQRSYIISLGILVF